MKSLHSLALVLAGAILAASAPSASAESFTLGSFATGTTATSLGFSSSQTAMNFAGSTSFVSPPAVASAPPLANGTGSTYALTPGTVWAPALGSSAWVGSTATAGPGGVNPPYGYYQFNTDFTAVGGIYSGTIDVLADDTVEVLLNGSPIIGFAPLGSDVHCADTPPNCTTPDLVTLSNITLLAGADANVLTFIVEQAGLEGTTADPAGVDFTASLVGDDAPAPEPSSLILLGSGLLGGAGLVFRRRRIA